MSRLENLTEGLQSSRRNLIRIGAIAASAIIAKTTSAAADDFRRDDFDRDRDRDRHRDRDRDRDRDFHCFLTGTTIRTADGDRKIEDQPWAICCPPFSAGHVLFSGSGATGLRGVTQQGRGSETYCPFGLLARPLVPMFRMPICMSRRRMHSWLTACWWRQATSSMARPSHVTTRANATN